MNNSPPIANESAKHPAIALDPRTIAAGLQCVHCGLCLPACPTFNETGHEADSPRGRIQLMLGLSSGAIDASDSVRRHLDLCLDCRGCETACPSGVVYHQLIEETRARLSESQYLTGQDRLLRLLFFNLFVHPTRLKLALLPARVLQKLGVYGLLRKIGFFDLLPMKLRKMEQMLPARGPLWPRKLPAHTPSRQTSAKRTIAFFPGCIGSVMFQDVNRQAIDLLAAAGADVRVPHGNFCCGAIHQHNGAVAGAMEFARRTIDACLPENGLAPDWIVTNIAGCGAMLREYDVLLRDDRKYAARAEKFASRVRDISEALAELGLPEMKYPVDQTATYHDACHLAHAQKVTQPPRDLLAKVPGLTLVPLPEQDLCCGAAGTYNLTEPQMSARLAQRKLSNIQSTGATLCITANVGCAMQIQSQARAMKIDLRVAHPVEILHQSLFASADPARVTPAKMSG